MTYSLPYIFVYFVRFESNHWLYWIKVVAMVKALAVKTKLHIIMRRKKKNYHTELSKISWYISDKQINYFPKPKAEIKNWSALQWKISMFCGKSTFNGEFYHLITKFVFI